MRSEGDLPRAAALAAEYAMFPRGETVLLAVSGGRDSMALLHWAWVHADDFGVKLAVGHYHHGMRGPAADADQARVADWCARRGIPFYAERGDVYGEARRRSLGVEEAGRELRYAFLNALADRLGVAAIATAHNADDNAETLLLHLARGCALRGLTGIPPRRGRLVRPLLTTTRAQIDAYVSFHAIPYGDDCTNADLDFARNRLRSRVTPVLQGLNPRYVESAAQTMVLLRADNDYLEAQAEALLAGAEGSAQRWTLEAAVLAGAPFPIASRAAKGLLFRLTGRSQFRLAHLQAVLELAASSDPSGEISLPYGLTVRREYDRLVFSTAPPPATVPVRPLHPGENDLGDWLAVVEGPAQGLLVRPRQTGDRLRLPKQASKSLKKLLIEKKIPKTLRDSLPVAADGDGVLAAALLGENTDHPRYGAVRITFLSKTEREGMQV